MQKGYDTFLEKHWYLFIAKEGFQLLLILVFPRYHSKLCRCIYVQYFLQQLQLWLKLNNMFL